MDLDGGSRAAAPAPSVPPSASGDTLTHNFARRSYGTVNLTNSLALGSYDGHPRADNGEGMEHRQILVDVTLP